MSRQSKFILDLYKDSRETSDNQTVKMHQTTSTKNVTQKPEYLQGSAYCSKNTNKPKFRYSLFLIILDFMALSIHIYHNILNFVFFMQIFMLSYLFYIYIFIVQTYISHYFQNFSFISFTSFFTFIYQENLSFYTAIFSQCPLNFLLLYSPIF